MRSKKIGGSELESFIGQHHQTPPSAKLEDDELEHMKWLKPYRYNEVCLVGDDELTKDRSVFVKGCDVKNNWYHDWILIGMIKSLFLYRKRIVHLPSKSDFMVKIASLPANVYCPRHAANLCSDSSQEPVNEIGTQSGKTAVKQKSKLSYLEMNEGFQLTEIWDKHPTCERPTSLGRTRAKQKSQK
ncbi:unnamed protein product [Lactuca saligna]|uniref:Uncharacterized protein n=1 Tax=Lactuca saligna TaxID=75948 RepID=A0AA35YHS9_LACSI|nr:unnamed protein product [Lactuca saligna]